MTEIRKPIVATSAGAIGAALGAASAYEDGFGLMAVMAVIGGAFGLPIGLGIFVLARALFGSSRDHLPGAARVDEEERERLRKQLEDLPNNRPFRGDDYYPGNPDPAWKTPDSRDWTR